MYHDEDDIPLFVYIVAGCIAGMIEATATWPFEYIKTQLQLQTPPIKLLVTLDEDYYHKFHDNGIIRKCMQDATLSDDSSHHDLADAHLLATARIAALHDAPGYLAVEDEEEAAELPHYTDTISGILFTIRVYGFWALYRGLFPILLGSIPKAGIRFGLDQFLGEIMRDEEGNLSIGKYLLAGAVAGIVEALIIVAPSETIKTKCIELNLPFLECLKEILVTEGIRGVYKGAFATVLKQGSNHGLRFVWYHEYKRILTNDGEYPLSALASFMGGVSAGLFSAIGNQPFDVLKTRMQGVHASQQYSSTWNCIYKTFRTEGILGFYKGLGPRLARVLPGQGIIFMSFEIIVNLLCLFFGY